MVHKSFAMDNTVEYEGNYYFLAMEDNSIYKMDPNSFEVQLVVRIPFEEKAIDLEYSKIYIYNGKIFVLPWCADNIVVYDMGNQQMRYIDLGISGTHGLNYLKAIQQEKLLVLIPCEGKDIIVIDMNKEDIDLKFEIEERSEKQSEDVPVIAWGNAYEKDGKIYFTHYYKDLIYEFSLCEKKIVEYKCDFSVGGLAGVLESENGVWIIPKKMDKIIYWNREKKEIEYFVDFPKDYEAGDVSTYKIEIIDNELWLLPRDANMMLVVNEKGHIRKICKKDPDRKENKDMYMYYSNIWKMNNKIYCVESTTGDMYEIVDKNIQKRKISYSGELDTKQYLGVDKRVINERPQTYCNLKNFIYTVENIAMKEDNCKNVETTGHEIWIGVKKEMC